MAKKAEKKKGYSIKEQYDYNCKRSKAGTKDRSGKPLSDFMRGKYAGKAAGIKQMSKMHNDFKKKQAE